jgi:DNA-binding SARP family transcriptional activator
MCRLFLFGTPTIECSGRSQPIRRRKAKALLAYLAITQQRHSREALASLLWPEYDRRSGLADLSRILSNLRKTLGANLFLTDRESVALHGETDLWVDVLHFREQLESCRKTTGLDDDCRQKLASAAELYQADFLAGFTLPDCPDFDEWQLLQTEALRRDLGWALEKLVHIYEDRNDLTRAIAYAQRWVKLDPLHEPAQRRLIALYARNGQRAEAHRQYQVCERLLAEELGVEPQPETKQLYEEIRKRRSQTAVATPHFVEPEPPAAPQSPFVRRTWELDQLDSYLAEALAGNGRIAFVTGGAGRGKTSMLDEFARRAQKGHNDLIVASGNGNFFAGAGDPLLPFREVLGQLTGDVATRRTGGQMGGEQARRLRELLPQSIQAILDHGPQLLDVFVSGKQLLARATGAAPAGVSWLTALQAEVARRGDTPGALEQSALFDQFTNLLHHLSQRHPLLITLDDLQWIDQASTGLLFHLGRRLAGSRILVVGAYRPDELSPGRNGGLHPLVQLLDEFKRTYGDIFIDLAKAGQVEGRAFVDAILDTEPNRLEEAFREALFKRTGGHPLFTVELLRDMQSRGALLQDEAGQWFEGQELDWETFPARVEAVIAGRVDRLDRVSQAILKVASVEGELFSAEVVARVLGMEERLVLHTLSQLGNRHRLVRERGEIETGKDYISSYQFSHALFQQYFYHQLSPGERRRLHGEVARDLAALYADDLDLIVVELAHHAIAAGDWNKALPYLSRAGDLAYGKASLPDAARHYESALAHWPETDQAGQAQTMRKLGECLWVMGQHRKAIELLKDGYDMSRRARDGQGAGAAQRLLGRVYWELGKAGEAHDAYQQALTILEHEPESEERAWALAGMAAYHMHVGDYDESIELGEQALAMARRLDAQAIIIQCLCDLGAARSSKGDWVGMALEQESLDRALASNRPHDAGRAYLYLAEALKYLGRYEQAKDILEDAISYTRRMHVPYTLAAAANMLAELNWLTGRWSTAMPRLKQKPDQSHDEQPGNLSQIYLGVVQGRLYNDLGQPEKARKILVEALAGASGTLDPRVALLGELVRAEAALGRVAPAASTASEILEQTDQVRYLYPNVAMALLTICQMPVAFGSPAMGGAARSACAQLERLDGQYRTPVTTACRLEGLAWVTLVEGDAAQAAAFFRQAQNKWQELGHPYDQARALSGFSRALTQEDHDGFKTAIEQAMGLVNSLAAQLEDPALKDSFLDSVFVREIQK